MATQSNTIDPYLAHFEAQRAALPGGELPWLMQLRQEGLARFNDLGMPTPRNESWKFTNLRPLHKVAFEPAPVSASPINIDRAPSLLPDDMVYHRLVFAEGRLEGLPHLSSLSNLPEGVEFESLSHLLARSPGSLSEQLGQIATSEQHPLLALNSAMMSDGFVLRLKKGTILHEPVEIVHLGGMGSDTLAYHPRHLIVMEECCQATVIEHHNGMGDTSYFANHVTEIRLDRGALLRHYKLQSEGGEGFHISNIQGVLDRDASYDGFTLSVGGKLSRQRSLDPPRRRRRGLPPERRLPDAGKQHCDNTTVIEHLAPNTTCRETFKGVIDDRARAVFQGRIVVHRNAQHITGHQLSKALLLSNTAEIDAKPELEIYADDVQCSHGATAGDLDHNALSICAPAAFPRHGPAPYSSRPFWRRRSTPSRQKDFAPR